MTYKMYRNTKALSESEIILLDRLHAAHMKRFGMSMQALYCKENIKYVKRDPNNNSFNIYYENGDWYHYCFGGQVY